MFNPEGKSKTAKKKKKDPEDYWGISIKPWGRCKLHHNNVLTQKTEIESLLKQKREKKKNTLKLMLMVIQNIKSLIKY